MRDSQFNGSSLDCHLLACTTGQLWVAGPTPTSGLLRPTKKLTSERQYNHVAGHKSVVQQRDSKGVYRTKQLAAYPPQLNIAIADIIAQAVERNGIS